MLPATSAWAQAAEFEVASGWTPGSAIPDYAETTLAPYLIADGNRTVHALASVPLSFDPSDPASKEIGIFYRQWTLDGGWTKPVDIMLTPLKQQARVKGGFLDDAGVMHMIFFGGDEQEANIYYSWTPASTADSAQSWSAPLPIGPNPITPDVALITGDGGNHLVVVYSGNLGEGSSLYVVYSDDAGVSWSEPELLFSTYTLDLRVFDLSAYYSESGKLHLIWNVLNEQGLNLAGYYAHLADVASRQWSEPRTIAESVGLGFTNSSLIEHQGALLMIYNNGVEGEVTPVMWFVRSDDGGQTFSKPMRPFPNHIGRNGSASLVVDGNGVLHAFFAQRIAGGLDGSTDLHGMWHSIWQDGTWGPVRPIVSGPSSPSFDPADPNAVVSQGNVILLTWRTDPGREVRSTWYAYHLLDAPEAPLVALPAPTPAPTATQQTEPPIELQTGAGEVLEMALPITNEATVDPPQFSREPAAVSSSGPASPVISALVPTILFVVAGLLLGIIRRRK